jgi:hypothetical protein
MSQSPNNSFSGTVPAGGAFTGSPQVCNGSISIVCYLDTPVDLIITVYQSLDGITFPLSEGFSASVSLYGNQTRTQFYVKTKYFKVVLTNVGLVPATNVILTTLLTPNNHDGTTEQPSVIAGSVSILNGLQATDKVFNTLRYISCDNDGNLIVRGSVSADNLITETLATRGVYYLVVGNWYRVASVGITSGAEWNAIGAIVDGESVPAIGRLFKCLSIGTNVANQGTCYDVEYNTNSTVSGTVAVSNFPATQTVDGTVKITDTYGGTIATTAGNLMVGIGNIYTSNPLHTILDSGTVSLSPSLNTATYTQAVSAVNFTSTAYDMGENSLFDVLMLTATTGTFVAGSVRLDYSPDGITWTPNNFTTYAFTLTDPHAVALGVKSGSRYVRVSTSGTSVFRSDSLRITFSSKRD